MNRLHQEPALLLGGAVRTVLELAGVRNILAKQLGSIILNNARAAVNALYPTHLFRSG